MLKLNFVILINIFIKLFKTNKKQAQLQRVNLNIKHLKLNFIYKYKKQYFFFKNLIKKARVNKIKLHYKKLQLIVIKLKKNYK